MLPRKSLVSSFNYSYLQPFHCHIVFLEPLKTPITDCWHDNGIPILLVNPLPLKTPTRYGSQRLSIRFWWTTARFLLGWSPHDIPLIHHMDLSENRVGPFYSIRVYPSIHSWRNPYHCCHCWYYIHVYPDVHPIIFPWYPWYLNVPSRNFT